MKVDIEKVIKLIMDKSGKSKKEILEEIKDQMDKMGGFLSEEGAAMMIAQDHGIKFEKEEEKFEKRLLINELIAGMNSISVVGRISALYPIREFTRKDGGVGKVGSVLLEDRTGQIRLTLWDDQIEFFEHEDAKIGTLMEITSVNIKSGWKEGLDMNVGKKGQIKFNPDVNLDDYPEFEAEILKILDLEANKNNVSTVGKVVNDPVPKDITTKDGRQTQVTEIFIADETGQIKIPFWGEKNDLIKGIKNGDIILVEGGYTKEGFNNSVELNLGFNSKVVVNPKEKKYAALRQSELKFQSIGTSKTQSTPIKIDQLTPNFSGIKIKFKCIKIEETREVGKGLIVCDVLVGDETGVVNFSVWNDNIELLKKGETYNLVNGYVNMFQNKLSLNQGKSGVLEISQEKITKINMGNNISEKKFEVSNKKSRMKIHELRPDDIVEIRASILDIPLKKPFYEACPKCNKKVRRDKLEFICPKCNEVVIPVERIFYSVLLDDGTGNLRANVGGDVGEKLLDMTLEEMKSLLEEELVDEAPIKSKLGYLLGKEYIFTGKVKYSDFSKNNELQLRDFREINVEEEINYMLNELER
ncbi:MAG: DUF2240 family protein [Candidatus Lokiarchaeota archaeon]|nr:DUF2240 family protein [Candidatus Lokiarchaeota archaeon]